MRVVRAWLAVTLVLAACQPVPPPKRSVAEPAPVQPALVHGRAFFLERMLLAPGATLDVLLIGEQGDAAPATIAQAHFVDLHGPPYDFELPYDPARIDAGTHYSLRANLRNAEGHLEFATDARVPVTPGAAQRVEFRLVRAGAN
ncbi:MAG TPA: YbaY family lipoprotein [Dokdonella sp.]